MARKVDDCWSNADAVGKKKSGTEELARSGGFKPEPGMGKRGGHSPSPSFAATHDILQ